MGISTTVPYITALEGDGYFAQRLKTTEWDNATTPNKDASLAMATRIINDYNFVGQKTDEDQLNEWPRDAQDTPQPILQATAEIALALLKDFDPDQIEQDSAGKSGESVGDASVSFAAGGLRALKTFNLGLTSPTAARLLRPFIVDGREIRLDRVG